MSVPFPNPEAFEDPAAIPAGSERPLSQMQTEDRQPIWEHMTVEQRASWVWNSRFLPGDFPGHRLNFDVVIDAIDDSRGAFSMRANYALAQVEVRDVEEGASPVMWRVISSSEAIMAAPDSGLGFEVVDETEPAPEFASISLSRTGNEYLPIYRILNDFAHRFPSVKEPSGSLFLYSQMKPGFDSQQLIVDFLELFPRIQLYVRWDFPDGKSRQRALSMFKRR